MDDHHDTAESLAELLEHHGFRVQAVTGGADAIGAAFTDPPAAVVTDILMPDVNGFEVASKLRASVNAPFVVGITAYESAVSRKPLPHGFDLLLIKPLNTDVLVGALMRLARQLPAARSA